MEVRNCKGCSKLFHHISGPVLCPMCKQELEDKFVKVKDYIYQNPRASVKEVSEETQVTVKQIKQWIREERLILSEPGADGITCEKCGKPIRSGRFCKICKEKMTDKLNSSISRPKEPVVNEKKIEKDGNKMRFLS